jgi:hypothetical protein
MTGNRRTTRDLVRLLAFTLAVLSVLFLSQVSLHSHAKGQTEANCQVCQAAHLGAAPTLGSVSLSSPLLATGYVQPFILTIHQDLFFHDSPSRAPPTA